MRCEGFPTLFGQFPALLRVLSTTVRQWMEASSEFIGRLHHDFSDVERFLSLSSRAAKVVRIEKTTGDLHNCGRSVLICHLTAEKKIVYKPRDARIDKAWSSLVEELNKAGSPLQLRAPALLVRDGYGWCEFIEHRPCICTDDFKLFYMRAGAWLCLLSSFAATDMHEENIIACGDEPVPIDLEMILQGSHGSADTAPEQKAFELAAKKVSESVLMTGLLPVYDKTPDREIYHHGGMAAHDVPGDEAYWEDVNTDAMRPARRQRKSMPQRNLPFHDKQVGLLGDHVESVKTGFGNYAAFLASYWRTDLGSGMLSRFAGLPVRIILRPTNYYSLLIERLVDYRNMTDGAQWSAQADFSTRLANWDKDNEELWPLFKAERSALTALNIPYFFTTTDGNIVSDLFGCRAELDIEPGIAHARRRLDASGEDNTAWQWDVIDLSTSILTKRAERAIEALALGVPPDTTSFPSELLARSDAIACHIKYRSLHAGNAVAWIGYDWLGDSEVCQLSPLDTSLYNGTSGVALFFAAHSVIARSQESADLAKAALAFARHSVRGSTGARFARSIGVGGYMGLGSIIYALTTTGRLLGDSDILRDAVIGARLFTEELLNADEVFDVLEGSAGGLLALIKLFRETADDEVYKAAGLCANRLQEGLQEHPALTLKNRGRPSGSKLLNGFSHGAAGIAYALASWGELTGARPPLELASELIRYENSSYSAEREAWPDFRSSTFETDSLWPCQWCHGAAGIGLGRIATSRRCNGSDESILREDIRRAVRTTIVSWPYHNDSLCCGTLGQIEFLKEASIALEDRTLNSEATRRLYQVVHAADVRGDFRWSVGNRDFNLGFFRGLSGVGYTFLRHANPQLPNVLTLS